MDAECEPPLECSGDATFSRLNEAFDHDPDINEIGVIVASEAFYFDDQDESKSGEVPSLLCREHKLGLAFWSVSPLYKWAWQRLLQLKVATDVFTSDATRRELHDLTRAIVLINADCNTAWNIRKRLLVPEDGVLKRQRDATVNDLGPNEITLQSCRQEIKLLNVVFSKHPKSGEGWAHRRWVLEHWFRFQSKEAVLAEIMHSELDNCDRCAASYARNYYAWMHRLWLCERLSSADHLLQEIERTRLWSNRHVGDYCCYHLRQNLLLRLMRLEPCHADMAQAASLGSFSIVVGSGQCIRALDISGDAPRTDAPGGTPGAAYREVVHLDCRSCDALMAELHHTSLLMDTYPGHEALWSHRRFLASYLFAALLQHRLAGTCGSDVWSATRFLQAELSFSQHCVEDDGVEDFDSQRCFAALYKLFLLEMVDRLLRARKSGVLDEAKGTGPDLIDSLSLCRLRDDATDLVASVWRVRARVWLYDTEGTLRTQQRNSVGPEMWAASLEELTCSKDSELTKRPRQRAHED